MSDDSYRCQVHIEKVERLEKTIDEKILSEMAKTNDILSSVREMVSNHEHYISDGAKWRTVVAGMAFTMLLQVCGGLYLAGQLTERVDGIAKIQLRVLDKNDKQDLAIENLIREDRTFKRNTVN